MMLQLIYDPVPDTAEEIHGGDPLRRAEIESRVLANQPVGGIATQMNLTFEATKEYEVRFFNERPKDSEGSQLGLSLLSRYGWRSDEILDPRDVARLWRIVAIDYGIVVLQPLLALVDREKLKKHGLLAYLGQSVKLLPIFKVLVAQACCPRLRTGEGLILAQNLATEPDWKSRLPAGERRNGAFAKIVAMMQKDYVAMMDREPPTKQSVDGLS